MEARYPAQGASASMSEVCSDGQSWEDKFKESLSKFYILLTNQHGESSDEKAFSWAEKLITARSNQYGSTAPHTIPGIQSERLAAMHELLSIASRQVSAYQRRKTMDEAFSEASSSSSTAKRTGPKRAYYDLLSSGTAVWHPRLGIRYESQPSQAKRTLLQLTEEFLRDYRTSSHLPLRKESDFRPGWERSQDEHEWAAANALSRLDRLLRVDRSRNLYSEVSFTPDEDGQRRNEIPEISKADLKLAIPAIEDLYWTLRAVKWRDTKSGKR